eukprot:scaffold1906_cov184-Pinguiococcus_pyrenoidosus.AAC.2
MLYDLTQQYDGIHLMHTQAVLRLKSFLLSFREKFDLSALRYCATPSETNNVTPLPSQPSTSAHKQPKRSAEVSIEEVERKAKSSKKFCSELTKVVQDIEKFRNKKRTSTSIRRTSIQVEKELREATNSMKNRSIAMQVDTAFEVNKVSRAVSLVESSAEEALPSPTLFEVLKAALTSDRAAASQDERKQRRIAFTAKLFLDLILSFRSGGLCRGQLGTYLCVLRLLFSA